VEEQLLRIGEVAGEAGVNIQTLRFYERRGLLKNPPRRPSGYREYTPDSVRRVRFIKRAQQLGFTLKEIEELLQLRDDPSVPCAEVRTTAEAKVSEIDEKIRHLKAMKKALQTLAESCAANQQRHCPLLESLEEAATRKSRKC
jgi:MerR family transcriptional regulator, copper efflux regulator